MSTEAAPTGPGFSVRNGLRRGGWTLGDQVLSSLTNFALAILVARVLTAEQFGAFALVFATYLVVLGLSRSITSDPLMVRFSTVTPDVWRVATARAAGTALAASGVGAVCICTAALLVSGSLRAGLLMLALMLPGLLLQDLWRFAFFASGRPARAAANDAVWAAILLTGFAVATVAGAQTVAWFVLVWGGSAAVAGVFGISQTGTCPRLGQASTWLREHRDLTPSFAGEFGVMSGVSQAVTFGVGVVAGLTAAGALRGATVVFGPINVVIMSAAAIVVPEGARLRARSSDRLTLAMLAMSSALAISGVVWGIFAWWIIPDGIGSELLGATWSLSKPVIPAMTAVLAGTGLGSGAAVGLRVLERPDISLRVRAAIAPLIVLGGLIGATLDGARGAAWGIAGPMMLGAIAWWVMFVSAQKIGASSSTKRMGD